MSERLHRIVYCSKGCMEGGEEAICHELDRILVSARRNNSRVGVTGALLYNADCFAQVLEGPQEHVEDIFETIQSDARHHEIAVIESGVVTARLFPQWSMAYTAPDSNSHRAQVTEAFDAVFAGSEEGTTQVLSLLKLLLANQA
jgi:hypothetical protein